MIYATTLPKRKLHKSFKDAREYCDQNGGVVLYVGPYDEQVCYSIEEEEPTNPTN
jgi:hypothetical protein